MTDEATESEYLTLWSYFDHIKDRLPCPVCSVRGRTILWDMDDMDNAGKQAAWHWYNPYRITVAGYYRSRLLDALPLVCHELRHIWQARTLGRWYRLLACRLWARWTIEPSAYMVEDAAYRLAQEVA
jgi:hypothetical protein